MTLRRLAEDIAGFAIYAFAGGIVMALMVTLICAGAATVLYPLGRLLEAAGLVTFSCR